MVLSIFGTWIFWDITRSNWHAYQLHLVSVPDFPYCYITKILELVPSNIGNIFLELVPSIERGPAPFPLIFLTVCMTHSDRSLNQLLLSWIQVQYTTSGWTIHSGNMTEEEEEWQELGRTDPRWPQEFFPTASSPSLLPGEFVRGGRGVWVTR